MFFVFGFIIPLCVPNLFLATDKAAISGAAGKPFLLLKRGYPYDQ
jgi:hypothetical protein